MNDVINVCYITDDHYALQAGVSMISLLENSPQDRIHVFLIDAGISDLKRKHIKEICDRKRVGLTVYKAEELIDRIKESGADRNDCATYLRLFIGGLLPEEMKRVIYIDSDTIINHSLKSLYQLEFQNPIAAVIDANYDFNFTARGFKKADYFNAGVLLINLEMYREIMKEDQILTMISENYLFKDQDILNILYRDNFYKLSPIYNAASRYRLLNHQQLIRWMKWDQPPYESKQLDEARCHPVITHYTWSVLGRPWEANNLDPDRNLWKKYYDLSSWRSDPLLPVNCSLKKKIMRMIYKVFPSDFYLRIEYLYFKKDFFKGNQYE